MAFSIIVPTLFAPIMDDSFPRVCISLIELPILYMVKKKTVVIMIMAKALTTMAILTLILWNIKNSLSLTVKIYKTIIGYILLGQLRALLFGHWIKPSERLIDGRWLRVFCVVMKIEWDNSSDRAYPPIRLTDLQRNRCLAMEPNFSIHHSLDRSIQRDINPVDGY